jgi:tetratricopeptide (TPR) repeat protein
MPERSRIDLLRRRVQQDPASIAFAQLAEEYRRIGELDEAVRVARAGLEPHPGYISARVTLGRALLELGRLDEAQVELETVVAAAPDNLSAIRALAEIHQLRPDAAPGPSPLPPPPPPDPALEALESWYEAIVRDQRARTATG